MGKYSISSARRKFIEDNFFEWSFGRGDDFLPSKDNFNKLSHPAELHYLAEIYNWDDGHIVLQWILESPVCCKSTANLLFWRSLPSYFEETNFDDESTCPDYCEAGFALIKSVLIKYAKNQFSKIDIVFNPAAELEDVRKINPHWVVPEEVYLAVKGVEVSA